MDQRTIVIAVAVLAVLAIIWYATQTPAPVTAPPAAVPTEPATPPATEPTEPTTPPPTP